MLEKLSDKIRLCQEFAAEAGERAGATNDPAIKAEFLAAERRWLNLARSYGFTESFEDFTTANSVQLLKSDERLQQSRVPVAKVREYSDGRDDILQLHEISTLLIQESNLESLYNHILDAAANLMSSDMASMQMLDPERNQLRLLSWKGFHPQSAIFWEWVHLDSACACGLALSAGARVVVPDIETCDFIAGTADLDEYRRSNIRAVQSTPLVSRSGRLLGMISTHWREPHQPAELALLRLDVLARQAADLIERSITETALRESNEQLLQLASVVESSGDSIITTNLHAIVTTWNPSAEKLFGYTAEEVIGKPVTILIPPERHDEETTIVERIKRGERIEHYETIRQHKDGSLINVSLTVSPVKNAHSKIIGASKIARDITERKRSDQQIATLAREAEHRTKNILATVHATVNLSHSDTAEGLKRAIVGRIMALAKLHDLFLKSRWTGAELSTIAAQELDPYRGEDVARVRIDGPHVFLSPTTAQAIAVTIHELATNAAKYGALSARKGRVEIAWSCAADEKLILRWIESGGPAVKKPTHQGFGSSVIKRMIRGGKIHFDWREEGLVCEIILRV
jgi:PAS domain S-box-containing protein